MQEGTSDDELVRQCRAGDRAAFDALVQRHQRQIYQLCFRFAGSHEDAAELAQDAFVRAYRALGSFKGTSSFATWLYRIAVNQCLSRLSLKSPKTEPLDTAVISAGRDEPADVSLLRRQRAQRVRAAIARLPGKQRATLILRMYHELSHEEIAGVLEITPGASKANLFHALRALRRTLVDER